MKIRRAIDVGASVGGLILGSPVLIPLAVAVKVDTGSVFFRQPRVGKDKKKFTCLKFKTMLPAKDDSGKDIMQETRLGSLLNRSSLNELPQLVNILRGDMSLIGPRPYYFALPERYAERYKARPGLIGIAQVANKEFRLIRARDLTQKLDGAHAAEMDYLSSPNSLEKNVTLLFKAVSAVLRGSPPSAPDVPKIDTFADIAERDGALEAPPSSQVPGMSLKQRTTGASPEPPPPQ